MKIELTGSLPTGGNSAPVLLCAGLPPNETDPIGPLDDWSFEKTRVVQTSQPVRAQYTTQFFRGLRNSRLTFTALRKFSTFTDAESFCLKHEESLPARGTLKLTTDAAGGGFAAITIANAELISAVCFNKGRSVLITYQFTGGQVT